MHTTGHTHTHTHTFVKTHTDESSLNGTKYQNSVELINAPKEDWVKEKANWK